MTESLTGTIKSVTYHHEEQGNFIVKVLVPGVPGEATVMGSYPTLNVGEEIKGVGKWVNHPKWGRQFKATKVAVSPPTMSEGIQKWLATAVPGVGKVYAKKMVDAFGPATLDVLDSSPDRLNSIRGIGPGRKTAILSAWAEHRAVREVMVFLHGHGLSASRAHRVYKEYGDQAVSIILANPYLLSRDIFGIGFKLADAVALKLGTPKGSPFRIQAAVLHALSEAEGEGSCGLPEDRTIEDTEALLASEVSRECIAENIQEMVSSDRLVLDVASTDLCLYLPKNYAKEEEIAARVIGLTRATSPFSREQVHQAVRSAEDAAGVALSDAQRNGAVMSLLHRFSVLTGRPGTGKTSTLRVAVAAARSLGLAVHLAAPSGKAAMRMAEATGEAATTMHRLLGAKFGSFEFNEANPLPSGFLVFDETSMGDIHIVLAALRAASECMVLFVGDPEQLKSVGPGQVLNDLIDSGAVPVTQLTRVYRQAAGSAILLNAIRVASGENPARDDLPDYAFCEREDAASVRSVIQQELHAAMLRGLDPVSDVQLLTPMRKGDLGTESLNLFVRELLNPTKGQAYLERLGKRYYFGDKVIQLRNDYEKGVFNGEVGTVISLDTHLKTLDIEFAASVVTYRLDELDSVDLAYALTVHKYQGSEAPVVLQIVHTSHYTMLQRNALYTGMTRAKKRLVLIGQYKAAQIAVRNSVQRPRYTKLADFLRMAR